MYGANGLPAVPLLVFGSTAPPNPDAGAAPKGDVVLFCGVPNELVPKGLAAALPKSPGAEVLPKVLPVAAVLPNGDRAVLFWALLAPNMELEAPNPELAAPNPEPALAVFPNAPVVLEAPNPPLGALLAEFPKTPPVEVVPNPLALLLLWPKGEVFAAGAAPKGDAVFPEAPLKPPNPEVDLPNIVVGRVLRLIFLNGGACEIQ